MITKITQTNQNILAKENGFVIFLALDITNSTAFKYTHINNWMFHFGDFFNSVRNYFLNTKKVSNAIIWKELGDEIIIAFFAETIHDLKAIMDISIYTSVEFTEFRKVFQDLKNEELIANYRTRLFCAGYTSPKPFTIYNRSEERTDIVSYKKNFDSGYINHRLSRTIDYLNSNNVNQPSSCVLGSIKEYDFIGPDIDIGFRIGKCASTDQLIVSDKIAYIYSSLFPNEYSFELLCEKELKGVWSGKPYPSIAYTKLKNNTILGYLCSTYENINILNSQKLFLNTIKNQLNIKT